MIARLPSWLRTSSRLFTATLIYVVPLLLLYGVTMWGLWHIPNAYWGMYGNADGWWLAWDIEAILRWGNFLDISPFNPLSGMGSTFPAYPPWLNPGALALGLPLAKDLNYLISYSVFFIEVCISNIVLLRILGLTPVQSVIGAQIYALVLFPPSSGVFMSLVWYSLAPINGHLVAVANFILVLFLVIGRFGVVGNLACAGAMLVLTLVGLFSAPILFLTYGPTYALAGLALLWGDRPRRAGLLWKLGGVAAVGTIVWLVGFPDYIRAMADISERGGSYPPAFASLPAKLSFSYWSGIWRRFHICGRPQELLCKQFPIFWFHVLALVGAGVELFRRQSSRRHLAAWFAAYVALIHAYEFAAHASLFGSLHVFSTPYLVWSAYPFFALFFVSFLWALPDLSARALLPLGNMWRRFLGRASAPADRAGRTSRRAWGMWGVWGGVGLGLVIPGVSYYLWTAKIARYQPGPRPNATKFGLLGPSPIRKPVAGPVTRYLIEHASVAPGGVFRGYTASYFGDASGHIRKAVDYRAKNMAWSIYARARHYLDQQYGNQFQETDLWGFDIPTFEEYGQWVTRQAYSFATELFGSPEDEGNPVFLRIYRLDLDLLPPLGVRFLITDLLLTDRRLTLRAEDKAPVAGPIYLYEIADPNLAAYSPTRPIKATTFAEALALVRQRREALNTDVIVFEDLRGPFVPARMGQMHMERDGFRITAESDGRSLVLVPVQFSRCFRMQAAGPGGDLVGARLRRANGLQTLLEFQGRIDAQVRFEFGLLGGAQCRLQDVRELDALGLKR